MSTSISGLYSNLSAPFVLPVQATTPDALAPEPPEGDTVTLSEAAQVDQLSAQGSSPAQIAENLGIAVTTVDLDLGILAATPSIPAPTATPAAHAAPAPAAPPPAAPAPAAPVPATTTAETAPSPSAKVGPA